MKLKKVLSLVLTVTMLMTLIPVLPAMAAEEITSDAVSFTKVASLQPDGTVDITMEAYTTGTVTNTTDSVPADIVLVLDMSGSMDGDATNAPAKNINSVLGTDVSGWLTERYGFSNTNGPYFIKNASDEYVPVTFVDYDDSGLLGVDIGHQYYTDGTNNYYPKLGTGIDITGRTQTYEEKQFYLGEYQSHMEVLKEGAGAFIADVAAKNALITDPTKKHRISIVKFATADYCYEGANGSIIATDNVDIAGGLAIGDHKNSNDYNYTQVVKDLTIVDAAGEAELTTALNNLTSGGATAVDYGLQLAEKVLGAREDATGRSEAVVVFTDGAPTHSSDYSASVAGSAINEALALKNAGVKLFSIGGANDADSDHLGNASNAFMHYISNNYPNASYAGGTITAGEGSVANGFYMTPSDDKNLEEIFLDIFNQTANSDIIMGTSAGVIDTISPFFTIPGADVDAQKANITLQISEKTAGGWTTPVPASTDIAGASASVNISGNTVTVRGFDFDKYYISAVPREVDGADSYGKKLIITISNLTPDYDEIDLHKDAFTGGVIPTNDGDAAIVDSENKAVATKNSPTVQAKTVTYMVDGVEYKSFYRFPGSMVSVISDVPTKEGHTFNGWDQTGTFTMPNADVVINGSFTANSYTVTYVYSGTEPAGATDLSVAPYATVSVPYGTTVTVAADATAPGFNFSGWNPRQENLDIQSGEFSMPAYNVTFIGYFVPDTETPYKVEHYTETMTDGVYELKETEDKFGETGKTVTATPLTFTGFTFDDTVPGTKLSDTVDQYGNTVLKLYYNRNEYKVVYELDGDIPSGTAAPAAVTGIKHGKSYEIEQALSVAGYDFLGWYYSSDLTYADVSGDTITVDRDIYLAGEFTARTDTQYKVEHWVQNVENNDYTHITALDETYTGTTDTTATAYARSLTGVTFSEMETQNNLPTGQTLDASGTVAHISANIDGDGDTVIRFYYDRNEYTVTYKYEGTVPATGTIDPTTLTQTNIRYGATVTADTTVPNGAMPTGYDSFYGWYRGAAIDANLVTEFTMPARDVELLGYFIPSQHTQYTVKHYLQNANDDGYTEDTSRQETLQGETLQSVTAYPLNTIIGMGYTYNHAASTYEGIIAENGSLVLELYYDRLTYNVTYQFIDAPAGKVGAEPTDATAYRHGKEVLFYTAAQTEPGYTFHGWHIQDADITTVPGGFEMPNRNVVIYGIWTANSDTHYTVKHYYENLDGTYGDGNGLADPKFTESGHTGTTGHTVTAAEIPVAGFTLDLTHPNTVKEAILAGDGNTTLELYYTRNTYTVTYAYSGAMPNDAFQTAVEAFLPVEATVKHGATVIVASTNDPVTYATAQGYGFHGWEPNDNAVVITTSGTDHVFTMPMEDVILVGHFHPSSDIPYTINHYLELEAGGYPTTATHTENRPGTTGENATVYARKFDGYVFDETTTALGVDTVNGETLVHDGDYDKMTKKIAGDGSTVFNFYYKRETYAVTYEFDGVQPHGITATLPAAGTAKYGTTVNVEPDLLQDGYTFTGWYSTDPAIAEDDATFVMPNKAVTLKGKFTANTNTAYTVEYYHQKLDPTETTVAGTNKTTDYEKVDTVNLTGTTGHTATAEIKTYEGFVARTDNEISKTIAGDGSTVIKLYYDRVVNPIEYHFYGAFPDHTTAELPAKEENVPYGAKREVAPNITCDPSHRHTATEWASPHVVPVGGEFTMPATKVDFYTAVRHIYKVEYDLDGGTGATAVSYAPYDVFAGTVIDVKAAPTKSRHTFTGWKLGETNTIYNPDDEITVNADIKLIAQYTYNGGSGGGGGGIQRYTLTYESNGGTEYAKETYTSGKVVALDKQPTKEGYIFQGWHTDEALKKDATQVTMNKNITVYADWIKDESHDTPGALNDDDHFAYIVGYPDGTVRPNDNITRAEAVTIFFRLLKDDVRDRNLITTNNYEDVNEGDWHNLPISTMLALGIASGRSETHFEPDAYITRAELAVLCARFDDSEYEVVDNFTDVEGHWAEAEIHEAAAHGWIKGYEDGTFRPDDLITRAEAMTLINRVLNRVPEKPEDLLDGMIIWPDNADPSAWYYLPVQEATNDHEHTMRNNVFEKWTKLVDITDWMEYHK